MNMDDQIQVELLDMEIQRLESELELYRSIRQSQAKIIEQLFQHSLTLTKVQKLMASEQLTKGETYDKIARILKENPK